MTTPESSGGLRRPTLAGIVAILLLGLALLSSSPAVEDDFRSLGGRYEKSVRPLVEKYCRECHSDDVSEADINLTAFPKFADVRKHPRTWQKVSEMLESGQMPPRDAVQIPAQERNLLQEWVRSFLTSEANARAGDPGPVILRRLSNAEYTYTLRDLARVPSLNPAREFPADGAAGEGFTNTGAALVMSPALVTKYFDAAKEVSGHAVLLPDGFRFSPHSTRRDWTNEILADIRNFYKEFSDDDGGDTVNLQGIILKTNEGGTLPFDKYLSATMEERAALSSGAKSVDVVARERGLNAKYLGVLWNALATPGASRPLADIRTRWQEAKPGDVAAVSELVQQWQKTLFKFSPVGHIGKTGGPKRWLEPLSPIVTQQEIRFKIPATANPVVNLSLIVSDAGDGNEHDFVVWKNPRLVSPGRPDIPLKDVRRVARALEVGRQELLANSEKYLHAAEVVERAEGEVDLAALAGKHGLDHRGLRAWLNYLGVGGESAVELPGRFTEQLTNVGGYDFVRGWGTLDTPEFLANSSDQHVRIPGNMPPHSVAVHPSVKLNVGAGWQCPITAPVRIEGAVSHAHPECGNGVTWSLELRRGSVRRRLANGTAFGAKTATIGPLANVAVRKDDLLSLIIGPRNGNHVCDLTNIELKITPANGRAWTLSKDVSGDILSGNPHRDQFGNEDVWHFYTEPESAAATAPVIPAGSVLSRWIAAANSEEKHNLAAEAQKLLEGASLAKDSPDGLLYRQVRSLGGPLLAELLPSLIRDSKGSFLPGESETEASSAASDEWGVDPALFAAAGSDEPADLHVHAPRIIEVRLPADLIEGYEFVADGALTPSAGSEGSAQLDVAIGAPKVEGGLSSIDVRMNVAYGTWTSYNRSNSFQRPVLVSKEDGAAAARVEAGFEEFRRLFPPVLCYTKIVPVDEVVTLTLFYREDDHLQRLMLDDAQRTKLDRLWNELRYVSRDALLLVDVVAQIIQYATQDADPKVFEALEVRLKEDAAVFRQKLIDSEPKHLDALVRFAAQACRRPLTADEERAIRELYARLRADELPHEEAFRLTLAKILVAPSFLYHVGKPAPGAAQAPVSGFELASRLSYFLWSSQPDEELLDLAAKDALRSDEVLKQQTRRMLKDEKARRLATEFACQWLHIYDFDQLDEKSEQHFPTFKNLRGAMYEESIQFFTRLLQGDGRLWDMLDADYTFLNEELAAHYGVPGVTGVEWRRVDGVKKFARGGILAQATTLSKQSGASRTSPILRGNWISEVLLGERLPRPPKGVPPLPDDESMSDELSVRQLVERHTSDAKCSVCHQRIDPLGFSLEGFDAIGRRRDKDLGGRPIDTRATTMDGAEFQDITGLRNYLLTARRDAFLKQFCRKLLGYALGRSVQLSDEPLLADMRRKLISSDARVSTAIELVVQSRQFREIRGLENANED